MYYKPSTVLTCAGYKASIMSAPRLVGEETHALPPGTPIEAFEVDAFVGPDPTWMKGEGCWVVPVPKDRGLWFDWRMNDSACTAVLPSVKGCNPITGLPLTEIAMHQYKPGDRCPIHGCELGGGRNCPECGYAWAAQDYVVDPEGNSPAWWDGFRMPDGSVRQFFFTEDMARDVASHLIGKENVVPAFGFAFFRRRTSFPRTLYRGIPGHEHTLTLTTMPPNQKLWCKTTTGTAQTLGLCNSTDTVYSMDCSYTNSAFCDSMPYKGDGSDKASLKSWSKKKSTARGIDMTEGLDMGERYFPTKEVAIGAGAKIHQEVVADPSALSDWNEKPDAVMRIYFVFEEDFAKRAAAGFRTVPRSEGMLAGLPVG